MAGPVRQWRRFSWHRQVAILLAGGLLANCRAMPDPDQGPDMSEGGGSGVHPAPNSAAVIPAGDTMITVTGRRVGPLRLEVPEGRRPQGRVLLRSSKGAGVTPSTSTLDSVGAVFVESWTPTLTAGPCDSLQLIADDSAASRVGALYACLAVELEVTPRVALIATGDQASLSAVVTEVGNQEAAGAANGPRAALRVKWRTENPSVLSVDSAGRVTAHRAGAAQVTAVVGAVALSANLSVVDPEQLGGEPVVARVTAGPDETFISWASPGNRAPVATVWTRPVGVSTWNRTDVPSGQSWRTLPGQLPGTGLEVALALADSSGWVVASGLTPSPRVTVSSVDAWRASGSPTRGSSALRASSMPGSKAGVCPQHRSLRQVVADRCRG